MGYFAESQYQLCGDQLVTEYCTGADMSWRLGTVFYGGAISSENPVSRSAADYTTRAAACLAPLGGCSGLTTYRTNWFANAFGKTVGN